MSRLLPGPHGGLNFANEAAAKTEACKRCLIWLSISSCTVINAGRLAGSPHRAPTLVQRRYRFKDQMAPWRPEAPRTLAAIVAARLVRHLVRIGRLARAAHRIGFPPVTATVAPDI